MRPLDSARDIARIYGRSRIVFLLTEGRDISSRPDVKTAFYEAAAAMRTIGTFVVTVSQDPEAETTISKHEVGRNPRVMNYNDTSLTVHDVKTFVERNLYPLVAKLDSESFVGMTKIGVQMVVAVVNYTSEETTSFLQSFEAAVSSLSDLDADRLLFGHLDGVKWAKFAASHGAKPPSLMVLDPAAHEHHSTNTDLTTEGVSALISRTLSGEIELETSVPADESIYGKMKRKLREHYPWSLLCLIPILMAMSWLLFPYPDDDKDKVD